MTLSFSIQPESFGRIPARTAMKSKMPVPIPQVSKTFAPDLKSQIPANLGEPQKSPSAGWWNGLFSSDDIPNRRYSMLH
jgi:hypothetical protein